MKIFQMRYFMEVCKHENITKAAQNLHVSQPSVTMAIKEIEEELGVNLFHRIKQRIHMTYEGEYLYGKLMDILSVYDDLIDEMKNIGNKRNHIRIGVPPMIGSYLFPPILSGFMKSYPEIDVEIVEHGAKELHRLLIDDQIDISLMIAELSISKKVLFNPIATSEYRLYVNRTHPLARNDSVSFSALKDEKLILFSKGFYITDVVLNRFSEMAAAPNVVIQTTQVQTVKNFISRDLGIGFLNQACVQESDRLKAVALDEPIGITIGLEWKKERTLYSDESRFVKFVSRNF